MSGRVLRCRIEDIVGWYPHMFLESHAAALAAIASPYSESPARFAVACEGIASPWLGEATQFVLEVSWAKETADAGTRLRGTIQTRQIVELASIGLALILVRRVVRLGELDLMEYGGRADYRSMKAQRVLEVSGTETISELGRRHREKVEQALANPLKWDAYVVVCGFSAKGHRIRFSEHRWEDSDHGDREA